MKKLTLIASLMLIGMIHAASVGWQIMGASDFKNGGYDVFIIGQKDVTSIAQITSLLTSDGVDAISSYAFATGTVGNNGAALKSASGSGVSVTYNAGGTIVDYTAFMVLWDADKKNTSWTSPLTMQTDNDATALTFAFGNQSSNLAANKTALPTPIPEPTSGLLMLIGGALVLLRRKHNN